MPPRNLATLLWVLVLAGGTFGLPAAAEDDPEAMRARIEAIDADDYDSDVVAVVDWKDVRVRPNGIGTAREHKVTKILTDSGVRSHAVQRFPFDPHTNRLDLITIRIYRADGELYEVPLDDKAQQPQTAYGIFWPSDQYLIDLPRLHIGDAIETITEMTGFNVAYLAEPTPNERNAYGAVLQPPVPGHWHDEAHFWSSVPIIEKRYSVKLPKDKPLQYGVYNGELRTTVMFDDEHTTYTFVKENIEPVSSEPRMEPWPNVETKLLLATLPTWNDKARWLYEVSEPHFEADDAIRETVHAIIDGLETDEERYTALNHWVAENIRYAGTSRGMCEGYTIHDSIETFHDRCGVCKDKAGLLVTFLRVAGYESFLVMTMARQRVDRVPADQFNHAVTCIRWPDGSLELLDPTWMPKSRDNWSKLEPLQHVVYGLPEGMDLAQSDYFPPEDNRAHWKSTSTIGPNNDLNGELHFVAVGAPEGRLRRTLSGLHPAERTSFFDRTFRRLSTNAVHKNLRCMDPVDFSGPLNIETDYQATGYALGSGQRRYFSLPMMQTVFGDRALYDLFGSHASNDDRQYGVALLASRQALIEETIELPADWTPVDLPESVEIDGPSAALKFELEQTSSGLRYTCDFQVKRWLIPPDEYENYKEVIEKFEELSDLIIECELEGARAQG